jgi:hypothetical protein
LTIRPFLDYIRTASRRAPNEIRHFLTERIVMTPPSNDFQKHAEELPDGIFSEFWQFLSHNKKWWLMPILIVILLLGVLVLLSGSAAAPFIYTLF